MEVPTLDNIPDRYTSMTESAVLSSIGTAMTYEVNRLMQVSAYLLPELLVGSLPIVLMAIHVNRVLGISKCN